MLMLFLIIPLLGSFFCWIFENQFYKCARYFALLTVISIFILSMWIGLKYFYFHNIQLFHLHWNDELIIPWIPQLGISIHFAIDSLSFIMIIITSFLSIFAVLYSFYQKRKYEGLFYLNLLLIVFGTMGVLLSIDLFLFFCFWEIMIIPVYFLIIFWGNEKYTQAQKYYTANKFLIYTQISSMMMLSSILLLSLNYYYHTKIWTFDYNCFMNQSIPLYLEYIIMFGFFIAFAVKMPIVPFHGWLLNCHSQSSTDSAVDLVGLLVKVSVYGLLRFNINLFKRSSHNIFPIIIVLGLLTIFYSTLMAYYESNAKKIIAYSSISHMGFILIAIYCDNFFSYCGMIIQVVASTLSISALFILLSQIYRRIKTNIITEMGGLYYNVKWIPGFFLFFLLANINLPGTINFVGEIIALTGIFIKFPYTGCVLIFSLLFSVVYSLNMLHKMFYGSVNENVIFKLKKIDFFEFFSILFCILVTLILGIYPKWILQIIQCSKLIN